MKKTFREEQEEAKKRLEDNIPERLANGCSFIFFMMLILAGFGYILYLIDQLFLGM